MTDTPAPFEEQVKETEKDAAVRLLNEAMSGTSGKSKNSLINEAIKVINSIKGA